MEQNPPVLAKKLWKIVRIMFFMIRKGISKNKIMVDLQNLMRKHSKLAGKALGNLMFHHHSSFSCRSNDVHLSSFVAPREYEFSCGTSPAFPFHVTHKRKSKHHTPARSTVTNEDITTVTAVQKLLEMLNNDITEASPVLPGFGFGCSPMVRQLRITDSPFPVRDTDEDKDNHVDKEAEEFIQKFYEQLRLQRNISTTERNRSSCARSFG